MLLLVCSTAMAQEFRMQAYIGRVQVPGFYAIDVTPALTGQIEPDMRDLRLKDSASAFFTPYIIRKGTIRHNNVFTELPVVNTGTDSIYTITDIENTTGQALADVTLLIANTAVERLISVSGSNDRSKWYIIDNNVFCRRSYDNTSGWYAQTIHFPLSRYRYFRLRMNNAHTDPLNIIKVGRYTKYETAPTVSYMANPKPLVSQRDSAGVSYIHIYNDLPHIVERVQLFISGPKFYQRSGTVSVHSSDDSDAEYYPATIFSVNSWGRTIIPLPATKRDIRIQIENRDDPPLIIDSAATYIEAQQIVVWLDTGKTYYLLAGNRNATTPQYDLVQFRDSIPEQLPVLTHGPFKALERKIAIEKKEERNNWLWPSIVGAVVVLGLLTWRLLKDMKQGHG
ncbi:hypothetical protein GCM10023093_11580 [Nemorincola caseinilytica]|uniref:DUF3999 domain-containing protein n=1 Tax=Nemorincola caseinilytica TaxID=2054315 RepID=A0ABP8NCW7_9BACT